ncbi:LOW QUALITY PROTEIN: brachyurin-like [Pollicipes pollicipes]|uniref:LOW QUALITY PROTEIN: brachyurin-like n=1 Tax=Pollicipes pollicipes TaxID=41117 RepID=UPI001884AB9B|nr:LOW QUALITY PROTEIN: brachyurin-like [Pollicipes pollicipes]
MAARRGAVISLTCTDFRTQSCFFNRFRDYLLISMDGQFDSETTLVACGNLQFAVPFSVTSTGNRMGLYFRSNARRQYSGFTCEYSVSGGEGGGGEGSGGEGGSSVGTPTCGVPTSGAKITGGERAEIEQYPWMAALRFCSSGGCWFCGGSLISDIWVLTAGHCTSGASSVDVRLGGTLVNEPLVSIPSTVMYTHPSYSASRILNDVGLIRLPNAVTFGDTIQPVCLPRESLHGDQSFAGQQAQVSGWGRYSDQVGSISSYLRHATVPIITNGACYWRPPSTQLCISTTGGVSSCNGDSGGPLQIEQADGSFLEVGIVSYGASAGCELGYPAGFARVTEFLGYISSVTGMDLS